MHPRLCGWATGLQRLLASQVARWGVLLGELLSYPESRLNLVAALGSKRVLSMLKHGSTADPLKAGGLLFRVQNRPK